MPNYCHNCGAEIKVVANFCPKCGTNLSSLSSAPAPKTPVEAPEPLWAGEERDGDEYIDRDSHYQRIRQLRRAVGKLDVEINAPPVIQADKLGMIAGKQTLDTSNFREGPFTNLTPEQVKEQFAKEAGSRVNETRVHSVSSDE